MTQLDLFDRMQREMIAISMANQSKTAGVRRGRVVESFGTAAQAIGPCEPGFRVFAVTRGQFSMIDAIAHCLSYVRDAEVSCWTWTVAEYETEAIEYLMDHQHIRTCRLLCDRSTEEKFPALVDRWRKKHGVANVRTAPNHAKMARVTGPAATTGEPLKILLRGSMNLNYNPRFENLDVSEGGDEHDLVKRIEDELPVLPPRAPYYESCRAAKLTPADFTKEKRQLSIGPPLAEWRPL